MPDAVPLSTLINVAAQQYGIDPTILLHQAQQESGLNQAAHSKAGAIGVMQLMPATARGLGVDPNDVTQNIQGGAHYMRQMLDRYGGDYNLALAAYNAGPGRVDAYLKGGTLPTETQNYVPAILGRGRGGSGTSNVPLASLAPAQAGVGALPDAGPALSMEDVAGVLNQVRAAQQAFNAPITG